MALNPIPGVSGRHRAVLPEPDQPRGAIRIPGLNFFNNMEYQMRHMDRLFGEVGAAAQAHSEVTEDANSRYLDRMTALLGDSLFTLGNCSSARSYYFNPSGEATLLRPMSARKAIREASEFPLSDYHIA